MTFVHRMLKYPYEIQNSSFMIVICYLKTIKFNMYGCLEVKPI